LLKIRKSREKKSKSAPVATGPGRAILPEDSHLRVHNRARLGAQPSRRAAPRIAPSKVQIPRSDVDLRLMTAMKTLRAVPDRERRFFIQRSSSPNYIREYIDAYDPEDDVQPRFQPTPADVSDYLTALSWVRHLDRSAWRILWWRSFDVSFGLIGKKIGRNDETARKRYETAVTNAWIAVNT
jgi:hypothetical protein